MTTECTINGPTSVFMYSSMLICAMMNGNSRMYVYSPGMQALDRLRSGFLEADAICRIKCTGFRAPVTPFSIFIFRFSPTLFPTSMPTLCTSATLVRQYPLCHVHRQTWCKVGRTKSEWPIWFWYYQCQLLEALANCGQACTSN